MRWRNIETDPPPGAEMIWLAWENMHPGPHWQYALWHHAGARMKAANPSIGRVMWSPIEPPGKPTVEDELREALEEIAGIKRMAPDCPGYRTRARDALARTTD